MERKFVKIENVEIAFNAVNGYDSGYGKQYYVNIKCNPTLAEQFKEAGLRTWNTRAGDTCATVKVGKKFAENQPNFGKLLKGAKISLDCYIDEYRGHVYIKAYNANVLDGEYYKGAESETWGTELPF